MFIWHAKLRVKRKKASYFLQGHHHQLELVDEMNSDCVLTNCVKWISIVKHKFNNFRLYIRHMG